MAPKQPCAKYQYVVTPAGPKILPVEEPSAKDEESPADYNAGGYLPVKVGDTFKNGRYSVVRKLGWGHFSTVWLVKDDDFKSHSALKVVKSAGRYAETARDEIKLLSRVASFSPDHPGRSHIVSFLDSFTHQGPEASHICIVFEPLGENLLALIERHKRKGVPRALVRVVSRQILLGLQYLHDECDLVHTDIKPENILISIPDIEAHISTELTFSPIPTSRRVGVPLPKSRSGVSIPNHQRSTRRQVQIFDSQPLSSPGRSAGFAGLQGSASGSGTNSVASSYVPQRVSPITRTNVGVFSSSPSKAGSLLSASAPRSSVVPSNTTLPTKPTAQPQPSKSPSTSSSSSSLGSSNGVTSSSILSTPPTSLSHSLGSAVVGIMGLGKITEDAPPAVKIREGKEPERVGVPIGGVKLPKSAEEPSRSWTDKIGVPASWKERISSFSVSSSPSSLSSKSKSTQHSRSGSALSIPSSWKDPGLAAPAPAVVVSTVVRADGEEDGDYFRNAGSSVLSSSTSNSESSSATATQTRPSPTHGFPPPNPPILALHDNIIRSTSSPLRSSFTSDPNTPIPSTNAKPTVSHNPSLLSQTAPSRSNGHHSRPSMSHTSSHQSISTPTAKSTNSSSLRSLKTSSSSSSTPIAIPKPSKDPATPPPTPSENMSPVVGKDDALLADTTPTRPILTLDPPTIFATAAPSVAPISVKIADLGNATPSKKHYTEDIQTRQYRSPEAIVGRKDWDGRADIWSAACLIFELLTGEYLFDPQGQGELFTKDDDHMAQIIELIGDYPVEAKMGGKYSRELFDHTGALRYIKSLKPWPLERVMVEKYLWPEKDSATVAAFLLPMLATDIRNRANARDMIHHPWLEPSDADEVVDVW